jgi:uncharacterized membrane protein YhiD involved in acid resistance
MNEPIQITDLIKNGFLDYYKNSSFDIIDISSSLLIVFLVLLIINYVYKVTFSGVLYSKSFGLSLVGLSTVTCLIIMTITSNIILSLGMVGALSIVRFRTAIKDPNDIVFMFWSIAVGIACGAGFFVLAVYGSIIISIILIITSRYRIFISPYLLIIQSENDCVNEIESILKLKSVINSVKSVTVTDDNCESIFEIRTDAKAEILKTIKQVKSVTSVSIVSYEGEYSD